MDKYFIYEVQKRTSPVIQEFYCYAIYNTNTRRIVSYCKADSQRSARKKCEEVINLMALQDPPPVVVWRDWPIALWSNELVEKELINRIRKREVS